MAARNGGLAVRCGTVAKAAASGADCRCSGRRALTSFGARKGSRRSSLAGEGVLGRRGAMPLNV